MIPAGLYIRKELGSLIKDLSGQPEGLTPVTDLDPRTPRPKTSEGRITVRLRDLGDGWCHLGIHGDQKGTSQMIEFLTCSRSIEKLMVWDIDPGETTFS